MLKVLLADDERSIIQLIKKLISPAIPVEIVGEAEDGETACEMILRLKPDIVITDIRMPGLDGVELMERIRAADLQTDFILISGYRDFEYARSAIRLGALEYLLKPVKEAPLNEALRRAHERRNSREETSKKLQQMEEKLVGNEQLMRRELMIRLCECVDENECPTGMREKKASPERLFYEDGCFETLILKLDTERKETEKFEIQRSLEVISEQYLREIRQNGMESELLFSGSRLYVLVCAKEEKKLDALEQKLNQMLEENGSNMWPLILTIAAGVRGRWRDEAEACFLTADVSLWERLRGGCGHFLRTALKRETVGRSRIPQQLERDLDRALVALQPEKTEQLVHAYIESVCRENTAVINIRNCARDITRWIVEKLKEACQDGENREEMDRQLAELYQQMDDCYTLRQLIQLCVIFCGEQTQAALNRQTEGVGRQVRLIQNYLQEHYREDVNLERIAKKIGFTAAYASTIFRRETGMTMTNWLINLRIEKAKELIRSTNMTINEIAWSVGYTDTRYFSKLFIRVVGVKPVEYRRFYSE